jgi:L-2-hydroxyglutarate oxidase
LKLADLVEARGGTLLTDRKVLQFVQDNTETVLVTSGGEYRTRFTINCAGLHSDRVARLEGAEPGARIIPFRGEYYALVPERRFLVRNLVYPVPHPAFPFLGLHFTRRLDGSIHAGPNAVLGLKREGYRKTDVDAEDLEDILLYPGFWRLAARHWRPGLDEMVRSFSKAAFVKSMRRIIPAIEGKDVEAAGAGVRAQALLPNGSLADDFLIVPSSRAMHVCNAPSPAATASLEIGKAVARQVPEPV